MSFNVGDKRTRCDFSYPEQKLYKLEGSPDKEWGITHPVNQEITGLYQKCLPIPLNGIMCQVPLHEIFQNQENLKGYFSLLIYHRNEKNIDFTSTAQVQRSEGRILQLAKDHLGTKFAELVQVRIQIDRQFTYDIVQNGVWVQCSRKYLFQSETSLKESLRALFDYLGCVPKEHEKITVAVKRIFGWLETFQDTEMKQRIMNFSYGFKE